MPLPQLRRFRVLENTVLAEDAFLLRLEPADGESMFSFLPGQWVMLHLLNGDESPWGRAAFSIASAPFESQTSIELAIKIYGDFTKKAHALKDGDVVNVQGPYGVFVLKPGTAPLVILAGGIGITPFRSMIRELIRSGSERHIVLFYSNRFRAQTAYENELRDLAARHANFKLVLILTGEQPEGWDGETRRFDLPMLKQYVADLQVAEYLTCGPIPMMDDLKAMLVAEGIDPKVKFRKELF
jgi:ferredoxin-NADP reductase